MTRAIQARLKIKGELVAETPLHVGGYGESFETDMALARNGRGEFYIPGTSLTGSLRSWFQKNFGADDTFAIWGIQEPDKERVGTEKDRSKASLVLIEDLPLPVQVQSELRDGVGIDRVYGAAAERAKFDRAVLPKGTSMKLEMTVELQGDGKRCKAMFGHLLDALQQGEIRLGASKTRGLGKVKLNPVSLLIAEYSFDRFDGILDVIEKKPGKPFPTTHDLKAEDTTVIRRGSQLLTIKIKWRPRSALMVKAGYQGIGVDMLPLTSGNGKDKVSLVLPGSSIKGAFRAQSERILRTLWGLEAPRDPNDGQNFNNQLLLLGADKQPTQATRLIGELFGAKKESDEESEDKALGLGALSIDDCYAKEEFLMNADDWANVETGKVYEDRSYYENGKDYEKGELTLWQALKKIDGDDDSKSSTKNFQISHHVAIDRWTGGASEGALFSVLQPTAMIGWDDISMALDFSRLKKADDDAEQKRCLMLLLLVLRDFAENRLPLGFATNRGMGEVEVQGIEGLQKIPELIGMDTQAFGGEIRNGRLTFEGDGVKRALEGAWRHE